METTDKARSADIWSEGGGEKRETAEQKKSAAIGWPLVLSYLSALLLTVLAVVLVLYLTVCNENYMKSRVTASGFPQIVYDTLLENYKSYAAATGFESHILTDQISAEQIEKDMQRTVAELYQGDTAFNLRNEIANSTYDAMAADAAARGRELNDTNKQGVSIVADACRSDYASYVSIPLASQLNLLIGKLQNILWIVLLASVLFCALAIYLTVSLSGGRKTAYRSLFFALTASALLCLLIAAALNPMLRMENLNLEPASLRLFLASYVRGVFESFGIFAAVYGAASALFLFLSRGKMVRDPAGRAKKVHRTPLLNRL